MKKVFVVIIIFLFAGAGAASERCLTKARRFQALQNRIVERGFRELKPGAWASYGAVRLVYLGRRVSPKTGKALHVIEFSGNATGQVWYRIVSREVAYEGKRLRFTTLEPAEAYMKMGGLFFYFTRSMLMIFLKGTRWGALLNGGAILLPSGCRDLPEMNEVTHPLPGGRRVKAALIRSKRYGGEVICSPAVPFGLIRAVSTADNTGLSLVKYGYEGGKGKISRDTLAGAVAISFTQNKAEKRGKGGSSP